MLIIGIDPGISGAICFLMNGKILDVVEMPTMAEGKKNKRQVNGSQIYNEILKRIMKIENTINRYTTMNACIHLLKAWLKFHSVLCECHHCC